jgi:hypothetical protein
LAKAPAFIAFETPFSQRQPSTLGWFLNALQYHHWYACTPRFKRRRYTPPRHAASASQGNSRQTDFKGSALQRIARFCHALLSLSVTAKPRFKLMTSGLGALVAEHRSVTIFPC